MNEQLRCRMCNKPRSETTSRTKVKGVCRKCAASIATVSRQKKTPKRAAVRGQWKFVSAHRADKVTRYPSTSWWACPRDQFGQALAQEEARMKASGASGDDV